MELLLMKREHLEGVAELERLCFSEPWSEKALELFLDRSAFAVVCTEEERVVAYGGMLTVLDEGQITNVVTHPDHRRRGYGNEVLSAMLDEAGRRGLGEISLEVRASNSAAISLYETAGFAIVGRRRNFYRQPTEDALVMLRSCEASKKP